jgi:hypothetical protein
MNLNFLSFEFKLDYKIYRKRNINLKDPFYFENSKKLNFIGYSITFVDLHSILNNYLIAPPTDNNIFDYFKKTKVNRPRFYSEGSKDFTITQYSDNTVIEEDYFKDDKNNFSEVNITHKKSINNNFNDGSTKIDIFESISCISSDSEDEKCLFVVNEVKKSFDNLKTILKKNKNKISFNLKPFIENL